MSGESTVVPNVDSMKLIGTYDMRHLVSAMPAALVLLLVTGCVERTVRIETRPPGALVLVNDEEVGVSPVKFTFLWYGDYDIIIRKSGYRTLKTNYRLEAPWYQYPPFDLVAETLVATTIHDDHVLPVYELEPAETPLVEDVVTRAEELRARALANE